MKKCASCTKDLPDAALHCVFCGAKQPPAPAVQQGLAKTAFGYSANDFGSPSRPAQPAPSATPPQPPSPRGSPVAPGPPIAAPRPGPAMAPPSAPPPFPPPAQPARSAPYAPPAPAPPPQPPGYVPASTANAATMFVPGPGQGPQPITLQAPPSYGRPNPAPASALPPTLVPPPSMQPMQPAAMQPAPQMPAPMMPMMHIPAAQPPPYLASQNASRATRPIEPWRDNLRLLMFVWGVALLIAFATPLRTSPDLLFNWKLILDGEGTTRLPPLVLAGVGLLGVIVAGIPMPSTARGLLAALLGLAGVFVPIVLVAVPPWRPLSSLGGTLLLVPSLILRSEYRTAALPRILVTLGALGILAPFVVPDGGAIPLVNIFKGVIELPGTAKVAPALALGLIVIVVMSLLAWLPAPVTGGAKLWAWLLILWALIVHVTALVVGGNLGDVVTRSPNQALVSWIAGAASPAGFAIGSAYLVLVGYGLASVVGKQLE